ncbi:aldose epimerase family protein [Neobacillus muris]|uniref:aldose epimerase family protein n=1 Tax=Neobacillus muris TaxID=2941334 RepID=UPI00203CA920|nr:aldose epimerase family protein [Neobacillus muris]
MEINSQVFGQIDGQQVLEYSLTNDSGMTVSFLNFGCVITKVLVPDRQGNVENVVLGFDNLDDYLKWSPYFGAVVGRVAGRIQGASFELDGKEYHLTVNEGTNQLHGGNKGFNSVIWQAEPIEEEEAAGVKFFYRSVDGEEGYPGNLETIVTYLLTNENELKISYEARTDQPTLVNLTNHSYFNLSGHNKRDVSEHNLKLDNDRFVELGPDLIPTGTLLETSGTPFDFRGGRQIKDGIESVHPQNLLAGNGYDHPLVFSKQGENKILLSEAESGRALEVTTDQPCVVVYTTNQLEGPFTISGVPAKKYLGICLETQGLPDAIHHSEFPSVVLKPEEVYRQLTAFRFFVQS